MKLLALSINGLNRLKAGHLELKTTDIADSLKPLTPGEWCIFFHPKSNEKWIGYVNPMIDEKYPCVQIVQEHIEGLTPKDYILKALRVSFEKRQFFKGYEKYSRYFFGTNDGLTGLIIDRFNEVAIIQINTAGLDLYRDFIKDFTSRYINGKAYFLDNPKYRDKEFLPTFESEPLPDIFVEENGIKFKLRSEVLQKVGFYFDHRENRKALIHVLDSANHQFKTSIDLFCYVGAWGFSSLKAGLEKATFVDQGNFDREIKEIASLNGYKESQFEFIRSDVFKKLDEMINQNVKFDLVLSDPPAFAKSLSQKNSALEGYTKLHRRVLRIAEEMGIVAFSSCTHYVDHMEFQKNILDAAQKEGRKLSLLYTGMQGWDHPVKSLSEKSNYIKCFIYKLEN